MKILCVGKCDYSGLVEGIAKGFVQLDSDVSVFDLNHYRRQAKYIGVSYVSNKLKKCLDVYKPRLVFIVAPLFVPINYFEVIHDYCRSAGALCAGWIGDRFELCDKTRERFKVVDRLYYTDSGFAKNMEMTSSAYLPLATDPEKFPLANKSKSFNCSFVAAWTSNREQFLRQVGGRIEVFGPSWEKISMKGNIHKFHRKVSLKKTAQIYAKSLFTINIKNANNVINGLNQRSFDPCIARTPLLHDYVEDLSLNFDIEKELLVFSSPQEFDEHYQRLSLDATLRKKLSENAYNRVVANHTYKNRAEQILKDFKKPS